MTGAWRAGVSVPEAHRGGCVVPLAHGHAESGSQGHEQDEVFPPGGFMVPFFPLIWSERLILLFSSSTVTKSQKLTLAIEDSRSAREAWISTWPVTMSRLSSSRRWAMRRRIFRGIFFVPICSFVLQVARVTWIPLGNI